MADRSALSPDYSQAVIATIDAIGPAGAKAVEIGYLDDDVPIEQARWWATAQYRGAKVSCEDQGGPDAALMGLYAMLAAGGQCTSCSRMIALRHHEAGLTDGARMRRGRFETRAADKPPGSYCIRGFKGGRWTGCKEADRG